jgi:hypothetical protein
MRRPSRRTMIVACRSVIWIAFWRSRVMSTPGFSRVVIIPRRSGIRFRVSWNVLLRILLSYRGSRIFSVSFGRHWIPSLIRIVFWGVMLLCRRSGVLVIWRSGVSSVRSLTMIWRSGIPLAPSVVPPRRFGSIVRRSRKLNTSSI